MQSGVACKRSQGTGLRYSRRQVIYAGVVLLSVVLSAAPCNGFTSGTNSILQETFNGTDSWLHSINEPCIPARRIHSSTDEQTEKSLQLFI